MNAGPIPYVWTEEGFVPRNHYWLGRAKERFTIGEAYTLDEWQPRSQASHNQYFASVHEAWLNLTEDQTERFPTEDHLRKFALIKTGFRDERSIVAASKEEGRRVAAFIMPIDEYAVVIVKESVVIVYTAKTQKMRAMGAAEFQKSKQDVLDFLAANIGVDAKALKRNAGQAA